MSENPEKHARSRRRGFSSWAGGVDIVAAVGAITGVGLFILAVIGLHDDPLTIALGIVAVVFFLFLLGRQYLPRLVPRVDPERYQAWQVDRLADQIENGPPGVDGPLPRVEEPDRVVEELAERLRENKRLCVILPPLDKIFEVPPGISDDLAPSSHLCQMIVQRISEVLAEAPELGDHGERAAQRLRDAVRHTLPLSDQETMTQLREEVVETLRKLAGRSQRFRLVPLADLPQKGALESPAGKWLLDLFSDDLVCTFGLFYKEGNEGALPPTRTDKVSARTYASRELSRLLPEDEVDRTRDALRNVAGDDMDLVRAQCAVITAAAEFGEEEGSLKRLQQAGYRERTPKDRKRDCVLAFRWLVGRKTANLAEASSDKPEVFDRCAVTGRVTCEMFTELTRDLVPTEDVAEELFIWLSRAEFRDVGFIEGAADGSWIRLGEKISDAAFDWLKNRAPAAYEDAQVAVERYYRQCLVMNRAQLPALGYEDLVAPGYGGLHLYETPDWWDDFYTWAGHAAVISAPEHREGAGTALVCLFLETWWWWGDQVRLSSVDKVLKLAREVFRDRPGWIAALNEFDRNYVAQLHERAAAAGDQWEHVASALGFISGRLNLRQGEIPDDPVLVRIYICWCFFSGDVAQAGDDLTAADGWFREAARACGDREDDAAMRAFARYQQADVWIPADPQQSLAVIRQADLAVPGSQEETDLPGAARALDDLSLLAYVARMYGDIRWESGDTRGAFDAYGRALMLTYVYQVDQESVSLPPSEYTRSLYAEMRTRLARRLDQARTSQHQGEADAAIARIRALFKPYWADAQPPEPPSEGDPLAGIVPPLPDDKVLNTLDSDYAATAKLMLNDKLADEIAKPADAPLAAAAAASPAPAGS
jgi:hypothetical protein